MKSAFMIWAVRHNVPTFLAVRGYSIPMPKKPRPLCGTTTLGYCSIIFNFSQMSLLAVPQHSTTRNNKIPRSRPRIIGSQYMVINLKWLDGLCLLHLTATFKAMLEMKIENSTALLSVPADSSLPHVLSHTQDWLRYRIILAQRMILPFHFYSLPGSSSTIQLVS